MQKTEDIFFFSKSPMGEERGLLKFNVTDIAGCGFVKEEDLGIGRQPGKTGSRGCQCNPEGDDQPEGSGRSRSQHETIGLNKQRWRSSFLAVGGRGRAKDQGASPSSFAFHKGSVCILGRCIALIEITHSSPVKGVQNTLLA